jgi:hypothetical protein
MYGLGEQYFSAEEDAERGNEEQTRDSIESYITAILVHDVLLMNHHGM